MCRSAIGDVWILPEGKEIAKSARYKFQVDGQQRFDLSGHSKVKNPPYANYDNLYTGKELVFDPSLYHRPQQPSTYKVSGSPLLADYIKMKNLLYEFDEKLTEPLHRIEHMTPSIGREMHEAKTIDFRLYL